MKNEKIFGDCNGSIQNCERRRRGVEWIMRGEIVLWRRVGRKMLDGQSQEGSCLSSPRRPLRGEVVDVIISLDNKLAPSNCDN